MKNMSKEQLIALLEQLVVVDEKTGIVYRRDENDILVPIENVTINNNQDGKPKDDKLNHLNLYIDGLSVNMVHHHGTTYCYQRYEKWCEDVSVKPVAMGIFVPTIMERMGVIKKQANMTAVKLYSNYSVYQKPNSFERVVGERKPTGEKVKFMYFEKKGYELKV